MTPEFTRYVCWNRDAVSDVLVDVALRPSEAVFLATHQPPLMWWSTSYLNPDWRPVTEAEMTTAFLDQKAAKIFMPIIGSSGTGKSHLIRWLATQIPSTPTRRVITIPKHETNLKSVLNLILQGLEGEPFDSFRQRLESAVGNVTREEARWSLLSNLVHLIEEMTLTEQISTDEGQALTQVELQYFKDNVPSFLLEEIIRTRLNREGSVIDRFVTEALSGRTAEGGDGFAITVEELPLKLKDAAKASPKVQTFYKRITNDRASQTKIVAILNHFLEPALQRIYQLSGDDLLVLLRDVRKALSGQQELVLLIEDFALLQGIQRQLLEAFIDDDNEGLCTMRVALAVTSGYFRNMDTVHTRITMVVSLDQEQEQAAWPLKPMTIAYLNAARWGSQALKEDLVNLRSTQPIASFCGKCQFREVCHETFGSQDIPMIDGPVGFYPLTSEALEKVAQVEMPNGFNPRFLLNGLRVSLSDAQGALPDGLFPTEVFSHRYARPQPPLPISVLDETQGLGDQREQVETVLRVWGKTGAAHHGVPQVSPNLGKTFGIAKLLPPETVTARPQPGTKPTPHPVVIHRPDPKPNPVPPKQGPRPVPVPPQPNLPSPQPTSPQMQALNKWAQDDNEEMTQNVVSKLRTQVYGLVNDTVNWESLNVNEPFLRSARLWTPEQMAFDGQLNKSQVSDDRLLLPLPLPGTSKVDTVLVLAVLEEYETLGRWPAASSEKIWKVQRLIHRWGQEVRRRIVQETTRQGGLLQAPVQLILTAQYLQGKIDSQTQPLEAVAELLSPWSAPSHEYIPGYTESLQKLRNLYAVAQDHIKGLAAVRKGETGDAVLIDVARLLPLVQEALQNLQLVKALPEHPWDQAGFAKGLKEFTATAERNAESIQRLAAEAAEDFTRLVGDQVNLDSLRAVADSLHLAAGTATLEIQPPETIQSIERRVQQMMTCPFSSILNDLDEVSRAGETMMRLRRAANVDWGLVKMNRTNLRLIEQVIRDSVRKTESEIKKAELMSATTSIMKQLDNELRELQEDLAYLAKAKGVKA